MGIKAAPPKEVFVLVDKDGVPWTAECKRKWLDLADEGDRAFKYVLVEKKKRKA
jgi:hypothetical protein